MNLSKMRDFDIRERIYNTNQKGTRIMLIIEESIEDIHKIEIEVDTVKMTICKVVPKLNEIT